MKSLTCAALLSHQYSCVWVDEIGGVGAAGQTQGNAVLEPGVFSRGDALTVSTPQLHH